MLEFWKLISWSDFLGYGILSIVLTKQAQSTYIFAFIELVAQFTQDDWLDGWNIIHQLSVWFICIFDHNPPLHVLFIYEPFLCGSCVLSNRM